MSSRSAATVLGRQSTIVFTGLTLSMALGLILQMFLASRLGTSRVADVFFLGTAIPTLIATATLGSSSSALIRYATEAPRSLDPRIPRSPGRAVLRFSVIASGAVAIAGGLFATGLLHYSATNADRELGRFLLLTSVTPSLVACAALASVLALADHHFVRAAWGAAFNGAALLVAAVVFGRGELTSTKLAVAVDLGYIAQLAFVLPAFRGIRAAGGDLDSARMTAATRGVLLLIAAAAIYKSQPFIERAVGTGVGSGVPAALGYAEKIVQGLTQLAAFGFAMASLPAFARDIAAGDHSGASTRLRTTFTATLTTTLIVLSFGVTSAGDVVRVLYDRGNFSSDSLALTRTLVTLSLPSVAFAAMASPLVAVAYANTRVREVVVIGIQGFALSTILTVVLAALLGPRGIVLGTLSGFVFTFCRFALRVPSSLPDWSWSDYLRAYTPTGIATVSSLGIATVAVEVVPVPQNAPTLAALALLSARLLLLAIAGFGALWAQSRATTAKRARTARLASQGGTR